MGACASHGPSASNRQQVHTINSTEPLTATSACTSFAAHTDANARIVKAMQAIDQTSESKRQSHSAKSLGNRTSVSLTSISNNGNTLNLTSLSLDTHCDAEDLLSPSNRSEANSRRSTGETMTGSGTRLVQVQSLGTTPKSSSNRSITKAAHDIANTHTDPFPVKARVSLLSSARQEKLKADARLHRDAKRSSGREQFVRSEEKRLTGPHQAVQLVNINDNIMVNNVSLSSLPATVAPTPSFPPPSSATVKPEELLSINRMSNTNTKSSVSAKDALTPVLPLTLTPATVPSERVSSETGILDILRQIGQTSAVSVNIISGFTRCAPSPVLSGPTSRISLLQSQWSTPACCAKLQCRTCKMDVMMLDHHQWSDKCSRPLFQKSYPNVSKLRGYLNAKSGTRAYCCACSWIDCALPVAVRDAQSPLNWHCAGHQ